MELISYIRGVQFSISVHMFISFLFYNPTDSGAVSLTHDSIDKALAGNELVMINFYADWCRFSNKLAPIFDEAADKVMSEFNVSGRVVMGKVDCEKEGTVATRFHIKKYPTLKVVRNGQPLKREYRGQRSAEAFLEYVKKQLEDPIVEFTNLNDLKHLDSKKRIIIGFFDRKDSPEYDMFRRAASNLKDDCQFHAGFGHKQEDVWLRLKSDREVVRQMHPPGESIIVFRPDVALSNEKDETFKGSLHSYDEISIWMSEKCVPLVREITFENAEELTEEGLPFLILFHRPDDHDTVKKYRDLCYTELITEKQNVNFLTADGDRFAHPLHHLGKSQSDLPLIAIDSFRHMYLFKDVRRMAEPGMLHGFIQDLYSGKLHREFHYGPDPNDVHQLSDKSPPTTPPESTFKKLGPSKNRYTLLRDEL